MTWEEALDALEERVRQQEHALTQFGSVVDADLPEVDGPLPSHLALRALAVLDRTRALEAQAAEHLHKLRATRHSA